MNFPCSFEISRGFSNHRHFGFFVLWYNYVRKGVITRPLLQEQAVKKSHTMQMKKTHLCAPGEKY